MTQLSGRRIGASALLAGAFACAAPIHAADPNLRPRIHDWHVRYTIPATLDIIPTPHPGWDLPALHPTYLQLYAALEAAGLPIGIMLRNGTAPVMGWQDPFALQKTLDHLGKIDYVFSDFESEVEDLALISMIFEVRFHDSPLVANAWMGAYPHYPGTVDLAAYSQVTSDRTYNASLYGYGLDVAMPNCYPYSLFKMHTMPEFWGTFIAPNVRSALFWAPLERAMTAKRALPPGHLLIPWMAPFVNNTPGEPVEIPPKEDGIALMHHLRLRGVDGYYVLESFVAGYSTAQYRLDMNNAWHELDVVFDRSGPLTILTLDTDKVSGVQWSGVVRDGAVAVAVSNLGNGPVNFTLPAIGWPAGETIKVDPGTHRLFISVPPEPSDPDRPLPAPLRGDLNGDGVVNIADLVILRAAFGACPPEGGCPADLNGDGVVDAADAQLLRTMLTSGAGS
ncbi:MAG TPA: dockerin type I domain-containing protein [Phycisphaerales bacterium]|nr:dockerin type I domain-containing protein [Phycisphaerales bacterium]HMP36802.1 dockerin type I domain-containing protein [Phycisphaerales bacterium]